MKKNLIFIKILFCLILIKTAMPCQSDRILENIYKDSDQLIKKAKKLLSKNPKETILLAKKAIALAKDKKNLEGEALAIKLMGTGYLYMNKNREALDAYTKALVIFKKTKNKKQIAYTYNNLGIILQAMGNYEKAIDHFLNSKKYHYQLKKKSGAATAICNMGNLYRILGEYDKSLANFKEALELDKESENKKGIGISLSSIGAIFMEKKEFQKGLKYYLDALKIIRETNNEAAIATFLNNVGEAYKNLKNYSKSLEYINKSLKLKKKLGSNLGIAYSLLNLGEVYFELKEFKKAETNLLYGLKLQKKNKFDIYLKKNLLKIIYKLYREIGDYKKALNYYTQYTTTNNKIVSTESKKKIAEVETRYEVELKENQINNLTKENQLEREKFIFLRNLFIVIFIFIIVILTVIYNRYRLKKKLNRLLEEKNNELHNSNIKLNELNNTKNKFFSIIAHDIKNPLNSLQSVSQLLIDSYKTMDSLEIEKFLKLQNSGSKHLFQLLENLQEWAQEQMGQIPFNPKEINLLTLIEETIFIFKDNASLKNINIAIKIEKDLVVYADKNMIRTVLRNLVSNAIKFSFSNSDVIIKGFQKDDIVFIMIEDSGIGIINEAQKKLFKIDGNLSTSGTNNEKGTGLGLIICNDFIKKNKGTIKVESTYKKGSTFTVTLPTKKLTSID